MEDDPHHQRGLCQLRAAKSMSVVYQQLHDGEWIAPIMRGYKTECCDCGLQHRWNFKITKTKRGHRLTFQAFRLTRRKAK